MSRELKQLEEDEEKLKNEITFIDSAIIAQGLHKPDSEHFMKSMYRSRLDEIHKELHEKVFVNILVKLFESEETNRTFACYIAPNCTLLLMLSILLLIITIIIIIIIIIIVIIIIIIIIIIIYPNLPRNAIVRVSTIPSSERRALGQDVLALSAEKEINK